MRLHTSLGQQLPHALEEHHAALLQALLQSDVGTLLAHDSQQSCTSALLSMPGAAPESADPGVMAARLAHHLRCTLGRPSHCCR